MKIEARSCSKTIQSSTEGFDKLNQLMKTSLDNASTVWTDQQRKTFFDRYMNPFSNAIDQTEREIRSIAFAVVSIENLLQSNNH